MSHPKTAALRNSNLLAMARGQNCQFRVPYVCNSNPDTVVAAHSNMSEHGKAGARKADDCYVVFACHACHSWYDQGAGSRNRCESDRMFLTALERQKTLYKRIINDSSTKLKERAAAAWALERMRGPEYAD